METPRDNARVVSGEEVVDLRRTERENRIKELEEALVYAIAVIERFEYAKEAAPQLVEEAGKRLREILHGDRPQAPGHRSTPPR